MFAAVLDWNTPKQIDIQWMCTLEIYTRAKGHKTDCFNTYAPLEPALLTGGEILTHRRFWTPQRDA